MSGNTVDSGSEEMECSDPPTDELMEESEDEDEDEGSPVPLPGDGRGRVRKSKLGGKGKRKKQGGAESLVDKYEMQDRADVGMLADGISQTMKGLMNAAKGCLTGFTGPERKKERNSRLKKFHKAAVAVTEAKLRVKMIPDIVNSVYEDLDLETVAGGEVDDQQFFALLEEFEETCMKEIKSKFDNVKMEEVDKDDEYQECLEVLNKFHERTQSQASSEKNVNPPPADINVEKVEAECSEGLEALTEFIPVRDPVTRQYFTDPYVNSVCGHVYEMTSITEIITAGKKRCPYAGCRNTKPVTLSDLFKDEVLEKKIIAKIRMEELD